MSITIHIRYQGEGDHARRFAEEMEQTGVARRIREEEGNEGYDYFIPMRDDGSVLLIDSWRDQAALDAHHDSPMMAQIIALREKYGLHMTVKRFVSESVPDRDRTFIRP